MAAQGARHASNLLRADSVHNGLAKLFSVRNVEIGPYRSFLMNRDEARSILKKEAVKSELPGSPRSSTTSSPNRELFG